MTIGIEIELTSPAILAGTESYRTNNVRLYVDENQLGGVKVFLQEQAGGLSSRIKNIWDSPQSKPHTKWGLTILDAVEYAWYEWGEAKMDSL